MALSAGARLGAYEIVSALGAGGMGEVYRARDTKLGREVALKILPPTFTNDPERLARFRREAQVLGALNHPHIGAIYGLDDANGQQFLVLELVDGESLDRRIARGPIPVEEALGIARQIADALEAAHDKGIIHRDLKPANIALTRDGDVKVLDFGLAKATEAGGASSVDLANSPTITSPAMMTGVGIILGTAAYMSPEQAKGRTADKRSDVWAFGCVLFEMLSGKRAFEGEDVSDTLANVLKTQPDWNALPATTPPAIRRLLGRSLEKDRKRRLADIADARLEIQEGLTKPAGDARQPVSAAHGTFPWVLATAVLAVAVLVLGFVHFRETPLQPRTIRFQVPLPEKTMGPVFELSPDGRTLAITASEGGRRRLWLRPLDSLNAQALPGTDDASYPFWSPDSAFIGFFAQGKLKKIALAGGPPQTLCEAPNGRGGAWNANGVILFSGLGSGLSRVPAAGGIPAAVTKPANSGAIHRFPEFLPDGSRFLFLINGGNSSGTPQATGIYVGSLDGVTPPTRVLPDQSNAVFAAPDASGTRGYLLFRREGTLMAQPFDSGRIAMSGDMFPLAEQVGNSGNTNHGAFSVSENGVLAYASGDVTIGGLLQGRELVWMERTGKRLGAIGQPGLFFAAALSADEKRISFAIATQGGDGSDEWVYDVTRGVPSRFTFRTGLSADGVWSPDGSRIVFSGGNNSLYQKPANGAGQEELLARAGVNTRSLDWSGDGAFVVYQTQSGGQTGTDLFLLPLGGNRQPVPYLQTPFDEADAQFSPDGRWMAYASNESGQPQVYVQAIPASGAKWQISTAGGDQPRWRRDGKELFYVSADQKLMAVPVKTGVSFETGSPQPLFDIQPVYGPLTGRFAYQPTADGQRFLVTAPVSGGVAPAITVVLNWQAGVRK
ncbi:MAG TPA: protein kinase [Vicinamibacterales bacterium]|jgi:Tol biopolymer transport system component|nr:protein kinase [Vicinamibacterales bacterium]